MDIFEALVAKISAANELYQSENTTTNQSFYLKEKVPETSKIYHNNYNEYKSKKISERELHKPWTKLSIYYKTLVILDFLKVYQQSYPNINLNEVRADTLYQIVENKGIDLKADYDNQIGKIKKLFGYIVNNQKVIKSNNPEDFISIKIKLKLKFKLLDNNDQ